MRIVVAGWYFLDEFYKSLWRVKNRYPVMVVAHRKDELLINCDLPYVLTENRGLEWGAYDHYLRELWPDEDSVLFTHDDIRLRPLLGSDYNLIAPEKIFDKIASITYDHAYLFTSRAEDVINCGQHGRMVFFSERLLRLIKKHRGFPFDHKNHGYTGQGNKPEGVVGANAGIYYVHDMLKQLQEKRPEWKLLKSVYLPSVEMGYRGKFDTGKERYIKDHLGDQILWPEKQC